MKVPTLNKPRQTVSKNVDCEQRITRWTLKTKPLQVIVKSENVSSFRAIPSGLGRFVLSGSVLSSSIVVNSVGCIL